MANPNDPGAPDAPLTTKRKIMYGALGVVLIAGLIWGIPTWYYAHTHESTDDAQVDGHIIAGAREGRRLRPAGGRAATTTHVKSGSLLVAIDQRGVPREARAGRRRSGGGARDGGHARRRRPGAGAAVATGGRPACVARRADRRGEGQPHQGAGRSHAGEGTRGQADRLAAAARRGAGRVRRRRRRTVARSSSRRPRPTPASAARRRASVWPRRASPRAQAARDNAALQLSYTRDHRARRRHRVQASRSRPDSSCSRAAAA